MCEGMDDAVDREREMAITCSIFRRFHNIRLAEGRAPRAATLLSPISDPRRLISLTETFPFGLVQSGPALSYLWRPAPFSIPFLTRPREWVVRRGKEGELNQCRTFILAGNRWLSIRGPTRGHPDRDILRFLIRRVDRGDIFIIACSFLPSHVLPRGGNKTWIIVHAVSPERTWSSRSRSVRGLKWPLRFSVNNLMGRLVMSAREYRTTSRTPPRA